MDNTTVMVRIKEYESYLRSEERSINTCQKYSRDIRAFVTFLQGRRLDKEVLVEWKESLVCHYAPSSVNSMLIAVNGFLSWVQLPQLRVKLLKIQRTLFTKPEKELTRADYDRLVKAAQS